MESLKNWVSNKAGMSVVWLLGQTTGTVVNIKEAGIKCSSDTQEKKTLPCHLSNHQ